MPIGITQQHQKEAIDAHRWFNDVRHKRLAAERVGVGELGPGMLDVLLQIVIGAVGDAPQLLKAEGKAVIQVVCFAAVVAALPVGMPPPANNFLPNAQRVGHKLPHPVLPLLEQHLPIGLFRIKEIFNLGLLKLQGTEDKLAGGDLVAEAFAKSGQCQTAA